MHPSIQLGRYGEYASFFQAYMRPSHRKSIKLFPSLYGANPFAEILRYFFPFGQEGRTIYHRGLDRIRMCMSTCLRPPELYGPPSLPPPAIPDRTCRRECHEAVRPEVVHESRIPDSAYNPHIDNTSIVAAIDEQIERLQQARSLLTGHIAPLKRGQAPSLKTKRTMTRRRERKQPRLIARGGRAEEGELEASCRGG